MNVEIVLTTYGIKASCKLFERRVQVMSRQQKGSEGGTICYSKSLGSSERTTDHLKIRLQNQALE